MSNLNIKNKLIEGESIVKEWATKEWSGIFATKIRIFLMNDSFFNEKTIEIPYNHISSLEYGKKRPKERLYSAIIMTGLSIIINLLKYQRIFLYIISPDIFNSVINFFLIITIGLYAWFFIGKSVFVINTTGGNSFNISKELIELYSLARDKNFKSS